MLVWINGAHGAGKTAVAKRLLAGRTDAAAIDPEQIGFLLKRIWPYGLPADFKALPLWRELTLATLRAAAAKEPARMLLVPMTLDVPEHFEEVIGQLRSGGVDTRHFTLVAAPETLRRRLRRRWDWPGSRRWAMSRAEACARALAEPVFAEHVATDDRSAKEVAEEILRRLGL